MMESRTVRGIAAAVALAAAGLATAQPAGGIGLYLEGGSTGKRSNYTHTHTATVGVRVPTSVAWFDGRLALSLDAYASHWHTLATPERDEFWQFGVVPMLRWRFGSGWFVEGGVGASWMTERYRARFREYGTRWNFSDHLGAGYAFGEQRRHEVGLYLKHVSNGGLEKPNPGQTFWLLRYGYRM